jgi:hypothetical protein
MPEIGTINQNRQKLLAKTDRQGNHRFSRLWVLDCQACGETYGANGCDFHDRKCPTPASKCRNGGGKPGLAIT